MTGTFMWPYLLRRLLNILPNLSVREQPLLPVLDVFSAGWVEIRPSQGAAAEMLPKMTQDPASSS